jgi:mRNA deadenylase 3'-5' endonuclease subunit Ccr4
MNESEGESEIDLEQKVASLVAKVADKKINNHYDNHYCVEVLKHIPIPPLVNMVLDFMQAPQLICKVITHNLLSPDYAKPEYFPYVAEHNLDFDKRVAKTSKLIEGWMRDNYVICLQELNLSWIDKLTSLFKQNNYDFNYHTYLNGTMGVGIAYPEDHYSLVSATSFCCGTTIDNIVKRLRVRESKRKCTLDKYIMHELMYASSSVNRCYVLLLNNKKCPYENILIATCHIQHGRGKQYFMASQIHALKTKLEQIVDHYESKYLPISTVILAGDFNIIKNSSEYKLLLGINYTEKELTTNAEFVPRLQEIYDYLKKDLREGIKFNSAYAMFHGSEPDYTSVSLRENSSFALNLVQIMY